jgi:hypothetical protein
VSDGGEYISMPLCAVAVLKWLLGSEELSQGRLFIREGAKWKCVHI